MHKLDSGDAKGVIEMHLSEVVKKSATICVGFFNKTFPMFRASNVLMYHTVGGQAIGDIRNRYTVTINRFRKHVIALSRQRKFLPRSLSDYVAGAQSNNFYVSFDDGYLDNLIIAAPLLSEHKIPFTVFVATDFINKKKFCSDSDLRELLAMPGASIGCHGASHIPLFNLPDARLQKEIVDSKKKLEDIVSSEINLFSYPHGVIPENAKYWLESAGYKFAYTSRPFITKADNDFTISRQEVISSDSVIDLVAKMNAGLEWRKLL